MGWCSGTNGNWRRTGPPPRGLRPARSSGIDGGFHRPGRGRPMCRTGNGPSRHPPTGGHTGPPLRKTGRFPQPPGPAAHSGASASAGARKWVGIAAEIIPKGAINLGQSLSHGEAVTAPFAQGSLGDGGCGSPRRPVGPPRNYNGFLSFRGAERRGNPFPFTMDGGSGRRGRRPLRKAQSTTQASRRAAKRPRPRTRGMGGNRRKNHPKRGTAPATAGAALSEAESAERGAGQIRVLPDDLRVQHGAPGSEVSAKPRPCSRRGCGN